MSNVKVAKGGEAEGLGTASGQICFVKEEVVFKQRLDGHVTAMLILGVRQIMRRRARKEACIIA